MNRKWLLTLAASLVLVASTRDLPARQGQPSKAPSADGSRDTVETFRKLVLRQLGTVSMSGPVYEEGAASFGAWAGSGNTYNPVLPQIGAPANANPSLAKPSNMTPGYTNDTFLPSNDRRLGASNGPMQTYRPATTTVGNSAIEGTYITGHGVLYLGTVRQLGLPATSLTHGWAKQRFCATCHATPTEPEKEDTPSKTKQADVEWESMQTGGTKTPAKDAPASKHSRAPQSCTPSLLAERIIQLLADHGHRFDVKAEERITIQLHVRGGDHVLPFTSNYSGESNTLAEGGNVRVFEYPHQLAFDAAVNGGEYSSSENYIKRLVGAPDETVNDPPNPLQGGNESTRTFVRQQNALAELHLKEGNYAKALEAYKKITESNYFTMEPAVRAEAYRNMAVVLIKQGKVAEAQGLLASTNYTELLKGQNQKPSNTKPSQAATKPAAPSHWTLTVSALKSQCDAVRAGKISLEEFAKAIEVKTSK